MGGWRCSQLIWRWLHPSTPIKTRSSSHSASRLSRWYRHREISRAAWLSSTKEPEKNISFPSLRRELLNPPIWKRLYLYNFQSVYNLPFFLCFFFLFVNFADWQITTGKNDKGLKLYDPGYLNTAPVRSSICYIDGDEGILRYRGYPIEELAASSSFLEVAYLLSKLLYLVTIFIYIILYQSD